MTFRISRSEAENTSRFGQVLLIDFHLSNASFNENNYFSCLKLAPFNLTSLLECEFTSRDVALRSITNDYDP